MDARYKKIKRKWKYSWNILNQCFRPHDIQSDYVPEKNYRVDDKLGQFAPVQIAEELDRNINSRKAPGIGQISSVVLKELSRKSICYTKLFF